MKTLVEQILEKMGAGYTYSLSGNPMYPLEINIYEYSQFIVHPTWSEEGVEFVVQLATEEFRNANPGKDWIVTDVMTEEHTYYPNLDSVVDKILETLSKFDLLA